MLNKKSKILVTGHNGMVGSSILRLLKKKNFVNVITVSKKKLNLLNQQSTFNFLRQLQPNYIIIASAKVGGIMDNNTFRADYLYQNLQIQNNLIHGSYLANIKKIIFLGSSCIYPRNCRQPIKEEYLLSSKLEPTNEPYAIAKIAGLKMCETYNYQYNTRYLCLMPCNLFGPNDSYDLNKSHFLPALIKKIHNAKLNKQKEIILWGNGRPKRELMHVDDLAEACLFFLKKYINNNYINIGSGYESTIKQYAKKISAIIGYQGKLKFDKSLPNGTPRKILDSSLANKYGWFSKKDIDLSLKETYSDYLKNYI